MRSTSCWWQKWQEKQDGCQNWSPRRDAETPGSPLFSLRPHCKAQGREVWDRAGFWGRVLAKEWQLEGTPHLPAGTAVAGTWHGTRQALSQSLLSAAGAEGSELAPLLLGEVGAVPLLWGTGVSGALMPLEFSFYLFHTIIILQFFSV